MLTSPIHYIWFISRSFMSFQNTIEWIDKLMKNGTAVSENTLKHHLYVNLDALKQMTLVALFSSNF